MLLVFDSVGERNDGLEPRILIEKQDVCRRTFDGILAKTATQGGGAFYALL
jgi:hypothetical protein